MTTRHAAAVTVAITAAMLAVAGVAYAALRLYESMFETPLP